MLVEVQPIGGRTGKSTAAELSSGVQLSHNVLIQVCLAVVGICEGAHPGYRERVTKHHLHVHPFGPFGPSSLLLLKLLDTLQVKDVTNMSFSFS